MILPISHYDSRNLWSAGPRISTRVPPVGRVGRGEWFSAPSLLEIDEREVHIWKVDLASEITDIDSLLSADEKNRAAGFHFERHRQRYQTAHAALRIILGRYLNAPPRSLVFGATEYGKPFLVNPEANGLLFNMSHAGDLALVAVARNREVGIDVEFIRADFATMEIAAQFFSGVEVYTLSGLDESLRTKAFFNCWTRKEAYVKARGEWLSMPLDVFDVTLAPDSPAAMLHNRSDKLEMSRWNFHHIAVNHNYVGALVVETTALPLHIARFQFVN